MKIIRTVLGDIPASEIGKTDSHDHLIRSGGPEVVRNPMFLMDDTAAAKREFGAFLASGGKTMVCMDPIGCGRNVGKMAEIAEAYRGQGNLVMVTGFHKAENYDPRVSFLATVDEKKIAALMCLEITDGMDLHSYNGPVVERTAYKAGLIKAGTSYRLITHLEQKALRIAAMTQRETGCAISIHTENGTMGPQILDILAAAGADLEKTVLCHVQRDPNLVYYKKLLDRGFRPHAASAGDLRICAGDDAGPQSGTRFLYGSIIRRTEIPMKFVMTQSLCAEGLALLDQAHVDYISADDGDPNHYPQLMQDADALIVRIGKCDAAALACCPQLKVIGRPGIGYDSVDVTQATKLGIPVVVTPGANGRSVAEHTVAMMLSLSKNLVEANNETLQGHWSIRDAHKAFQWEGKTVGIIGLGPIGRETAKICLGIGMKVIGFDSFFSKEQIQSWGVEYCQNKEDLLRTSDIVSVHMPLVEATRNLICASELALMKKTALLINTSRGGIVNEADLLQALTSGQITAAGLDVFCSEPLRVDDPLLQAPNLLVTPHAAAQTREAVIQMATMCVEGCLAVCRGEQWPYVVDKNVYDHPRWADCK